MTDADPNGQNVDLGDGALSGNAAISLDAWAKSRFGIQRVSAPINIMERLNTEPQPQVTFDKVMKYIEEEYSKGHLNGGDRARILCSGLNAMNGTESDTAAIAACPSKVKSGIGTASIEKDALSEAVMSEVKRRDYLTAISEMLGQIARTKPDLLQIGISEFSCTHRDGRLNRRRVRAIE